MPCIKTAHGWDIAYRDSYTGLRWVIHRPSRSADFEEGKLKAVGVPMSGKAMMPVLLGACLEDTAADRL